MVGGTSVWLASSTFVVVIALMSRRGLGGGTGIGRLLFAWDSEHFLTMARSGYFS